MGKVSKGKQTKTFLKKGLLSGQIKKRHEIKAFKQKVKGRQVKRNRRADDIKPADAEQEDGEDSLDEEAGNRAKDSGEEDGAEMDVEDVLGADGLQTDDQVRHSRCNSVSLPKPIPLPSPQSGDDDDDLALEDDDLSNLGSDSDNETASGSGKQSHVADLKALAEKDPDFFKYLQENDAELLQFNEDDNEQDDDDLEEHDQDDDDDEDEEDTSSRGKKVEKDPKAAPVLTHEILRKWQRFILQTRSIRSLKKLLLAFRSAATTGSHQTSLQRARWEIQSPKVFHNLIIASLKLTPVTLSSAVPCKENDGKYKLATNTKAYALAQRLIKSYFVSLHALLGSVSTSSGIPSVAVNESSKLVPYIVGNHKIARDWVKLLLSLYESSTDEVRVAAFLGLRKLAIASDHSLRESVLKGVYATFLSSSKTTNVHSLPSLNLMKNAASQLFLIEGKQEQELVYQLTFGYVRMLAMLLRKAFKDGSKVGQNSHNFWRKAVLIRHGSIALQDSFKSVYNWQFVHAFDFWSIVLSSACDLERTSFQTYDSPLRQLLYPLIQVGQGAIRLVPTSRYFPLRFHLIRSLLRIVQKSGVYIPLATSLFEVLDSPELGGTSQTGLAARALKRSTLKALNFELYLKAPLKYPKTRVYADGLADEVVHLLGEYLTAWSTSIAFPEWSLPCIVTLKRHAKKTRQAKLGTLIKVLVDKTEMNAKWIEGEREKIEFAPMQRDKVERFLLGFEKEKTPLGGWMRLQRKVRESTRQMADQAARAEGIEVEAEDEDE